MASQEKNNSKPATATAASRRDFLRVAGLSGAGLVLGFSAQAKGKKETLVNLAHETAAVLSFELHPFIVIDNAGGITLINHRPDMGQASWQAVPMMIAEELEVSMDQIKIQQSTGLRKYGDQLSGGSSTVRTGWKRLREAGAAAREMFLQAAATEWKVSKADCYAKDGRVYHKPSGKSLGYGELVEQASLLEVPTNLPLKAKKDFKILGKALPRPEVPSKVTGVAEFGMDIEVPGMLYASIERSPVIHGKVVSFDDTNAKKVPGFKMAIKGERKLPYKALESVAVLADNYWAALQGRKALKIQWDNGNYPAEMDSGKYSSKLLEAASQDAPTYSNIGDVQAALDKATIVRNAYYETPLLAHAPMEPQVAVAHVKEDGSCEIWAPVQGPDAAISEVSAYLGIEPERVSVHVPFLGGAFGRKGYLDFVLEAVYLSKQAKAPVKVIWTREDDIQQGPYRPAMLSAMRGGVDANGNIVAFQHTLVGESISGQVFQAFKEGSPDPWAGEAISHEESPYAIPNYKVGFNRVKTDIPIVWWRSVYPSNSSFGHECFFDELAEAARKDPLAARMELMKDDERFYTVLKTLKEKSGWDAKLPEGMGKGVAIAKSFDSVCAHAVFVKKEGTGVVVDRVVTVLDCGMYVNPDNVRAQTEGNIVMGITAATKPAITFANGKAQQSNFHQYQVMRIDEMPKVEIHIVENERAPGGVGEPALPPMAPALCNAIYSATGVRVWKLPVDLKKIV